MKIEHALLVGGASPAVPRNACLRPLLLYGWRVEESANHQAANYTVCGRVAVALTVAYSQLPCAAVCMTVCDSVA